MLTAQRSIALTAAVLVAALIGIQLGSGAIGAINPIFFAEKQPHPRDRGAAVDLRDIEARRLARQAAAYDRYYDWGDGNSSLSLACTDCASRAVVMRGRVGDGYVPYFGSREEIAADDARMLREIEERDRDRIATEERRALLARAERAVEEIVERPMVREPEAAPAVVEEVRETPAVEPSEQSPSL